MKKIILVTIALLSITGCSNKEESSYIADKYAATFNGTDTTISSNVDQEQYFEDINEVMADTYWELNDFLLKQWATEDDFILLLETFEFGISRARNHSYPNNSGDVTIKNFNDELVLILSTVYYAHDSMREGYTDPNYDFTIVNNSIDLYNNLLNAHSELREKYGFQE